MGKNLVLISNRSEDREFAIEVALMAGMNLTTTASAAEAAELISNGSAGALLVNADTKELYEAFESTIQNTIGLFSDLLNTNLIHFISDEDMEDRPYLAQSPLMGNFVLRRYTNADEAKLAAARYGHVVKASLMERSFGLKNFFSAKSQIQVVQLKRSDQKQQIVEAIRGYLVKAKYPTRMANVIANGIDEIIMNAIFTAPIDELGRHIYDQTARDKIIPLENRAAVEVTVCFDGKQVGVSVADRWGSINKEKLVKHLSMIYKDDSYKVRTSVAGAGIGMSHTFRSGGSLVFVCEKHAKTEVALIFERYDGYREFKAQFRFISLQFYY